MRRAGLLVRLTLLGALATIAGCKERNQTAVPIEDGGPGDTASGGDGTAGSDAGTPGGPGTGGAPNSGSGTGGAAPGGSGGIVGGTASGGAGGSGGVSTGTGGVTAGTGGATGTASGGAGGAIVSATAQLASAVYNLHLDNIELGTTGPQGTWHVENRGQTATGKPSLTNDNGSELLVGTNGCTAALPAGGACDITYALKPSMIGTRGGMLTISASPGGSITLWVTVDAGYKLTVVKTGAASSSTVTGGGLNCGSTCSIVVLPTTMVALRAQTTNGSNVFFTGWTGGTTCAGQNVETCATMLTGPATVTAVFTPMTNNLIFVSAETYNMAMSGAAKYDAVCNGVATSAGINNTTGDDYVAAVSDSTSAFKTRLGTSARGWVRKDGAPFADTQAALFNNNAVLNAPSITQSGGKIDFAQTVLTGTNSDGTAAADNCANWTSASASVKGVQSSVTGGPQAWLTGPSATCDGFSRVICLGRSRTTALAIPPATGRRIWITNTAFTPGGSKTPDQQCQAEKPSDVTKAVALVSIGARAAGTLLDMATTYLRPDGIVVGTGAEIATMKVRSGIWQSADQTYGMKQLGGIWTGSMTPTLVGVDGTCGDWTMNTGLNGAWGTALETSVDWWSVRNSPYHSCTATPGSGLYCIAVP